MPVLPTPIIDFLEDASINILIFIALKWSAQSRSRLGKILALLILAPGVATLWTAISKYINQTVPNAETLSLVGIGALIVNALCAYKLASYKNKAGSLMKAAFLSARNDVLANIAIIAVGFITLTTKSFWPDLIVGLGIVLMNVDSAKEIWEEASKERPQI